MLLYYCTTLTQFRAGSFWVVSQTGYETNCTSYAVRNIQCKMICFSYFTGVFFVTVCTSQQKLLVVLLPFSSPPLSFPRYFETLHQKANYLAWKLRYHRRMNSSNHLLVLLTYLKCWIQNQRLRMKIRHESGQQQHIFSYKLLKFYGK